MKLVVALLFTCCLAVSQAKVNTFGLASTGTNPKLLANLEGLFSELFRNMPNFSVPATAFFPFPKPSTNATEIARNVHTLLVKLENMEKLDELRLIDWAATLYPVFNVLFTNIVGPILMKIFSLIPITLLPMLFGGATTVDAAVGYAIMSVYNPFIAFLNTYFFG